MILGEGQFLVSEVPLEDRGYSRVQLKLAFEDLRFPCDITRLVTSKTAETVQGLRFDHVVQRREQTAAERESEREGVGAREREGGIGSERV